MFHLNYHHLLPLLTPSKVRLRVEANFFGLPEPFFALGGYSLQLTIVQSGEKTACLFSRRKRTVLARTALWSFCALWQSSRRVTNRCEPFPLSKMSSAVHYATHRPKGGAMGRWG